MNRIKLLTFNVTIFYELLTISVQTDKAFSLQLKYIDFMYFSLRKIHFAKFFRLQFNSFCEKLYCGVQTFSSVCTNFINLSFGI